MTKAIALIYGRDSLASNAFNPLALIDAFMHPNMILIEALRDIHRRSRQDAKSALHDAFTVSGRPLVFGVLNGRDYQRAASASVAQLSPNQRTDIPPQPSFLNGRSNSIDIFLEDIALQTRRTLKPVDVFMLVASKPKNLQSYVRRLPAGSTLIAVQTPPSSRGHQSFWDMVQNPILHGVVEPDARTLLNYYLVSNGPMVGTPHIAVSGKPQRHINDIWEYYTQNNPHTLSTREAMNAAQHFNMLMPFMASHDYQRLTNARQYIGHFGPKAKPIDSACQAWALETMWNDMFGQYGGHRQRKFASDAAARVKIKPAAATTQTTTQAATRKPVTASPATSVADTSASAPAHRQRLTNSQIGSLYKPGKRLLQQHPAVIRRLLHKG